MDLETVWTGAHDVSKAKSQQLSAPPPMAYGDQASPAVRPTIRDWLLSRPRHRAYTQEQIRRATKSGNGAVSKVLSKLIAAGLYERLSTGVIASQEGPLYAYRRVAKQTQERAA